MEHSDYIETEHAGSSLSGFIQACPLCFGEVRHDGSDWSSNLSLTDSNRPWVCGSCGTEYTTDELVRLLQVNEL